MTVCAEHLVRTECAPEDGRGEKCVDPGTSEVVGLVGGADSLDFVHLEIKNPCADECGDQGGDYLCPEGVSRWDFHVVREFEVVGKGEGVGTGYIAGI